MRVVTWNCRRATAKNSVWEHLRNLDPDVAFLQEVCSSPPWVAECYSLIQRRAVRKTGDAQVFSSLLLVRGKVSPERSLTSGTRWVADELVRFSSNVFANEVLPDASSRSMVAVSVYNPAWPIPRDRLSNCDLENIKLTKQKDVWVADLLRQAILEADIRPEVPWLICGDFNLCETFDEWRGGPRGNREYLDRLAALGLTDCLRLSQGSITPTYKTIQTGRIKSQLDYIFVTDAMRQRLVSCRTGPHDLIHAGVSDHLPVIADFDMAN
jgi:endonuclease/exonuclease/phosphatase family metal-dependent hydrolase